MKITESQIRKTIRKIVAEQAAGAGRVKIPLTSTYEAEETGEDYAVVGRSGGKIYLEGVGEDGSEFTLKASEEEMKAIASAIMSM